MEASGVSTCSLIPGAPVMARTASVRLPWLSTHPFGRPVVPEV